jgi:hypothetical protein
MRSKWTLLAGIILLATGIILRRTTDLALEGLLLILTGVVLKTAYIINKARSGEYLPGYELIFLFLGLILFMSGLYLRSHEPPFNPVLLIITGITLKIVFIIMFILKTRARRKTLMTNP